MKNDFEKFMYRMALLVIILLLAAAASKANTALWPAQAIDADNSQPALGVLR